MEFEMLLHDIGNAVNLKAGLLLQLSYIAFDAIKIHDSFNTNAR